MGMGSELVLGYVARDWGNLGLREGLVLTRRGRDFMEERLTEERLAGHYDNLKVAHELSLSDAGFTIIGRDSKSDHVFAETPLGRREFSTWGVHLFFDPEEVGDDESTACIGVPISGRYFPRFADWESAHGTMPMAFDARLDRLQGIARRRIVEAVPELSSAYWIVKEVYY